MTKNEININEILQKNSLVRQSKYNGGNLQTGEGFNKTSLFILPMFDLSYKERPLSIFLRNAFIDDLELEHNIDSGVFLLLKCPTERDSLWKKLENVLSKHPNYITDYYIGREDKSDLIMYVLQIPKKYENDFTLFKQSRYSQMSDEYKKLFPRYVQTASGQKKESQIWGVLNKSEDLKDKIVKEFINPHTSTPEEIIQLRREMNDWNEIWDKINPLEEIYGKQIES